MPALKLYCSKRQSGDNVHWDLVYEVNAAHGSRYVQLSGHAKLASIRGCMTTSLMAPSPPDKPQIGLLPHPGPWPSPQVTSAYSYQFIIPVTLSLTDRH
jgi:hypothetical protein